MTDHIEPPYFPTADEVYRFMVSNPRVSASFLIEIMEKSRADSRYSNGRLREIWKEAGGVVDKKGRAWIEADFLPGLLRILNEVPPEPEHPDNCPHPCCD